MLLAALVFLVCRKHRISIHTTQVCQNSSLFPMYDLTFYLKLSIPSFGKNFNQTLLGKINQVRVFFSEPFSVGLKISSKNKEEAETVILSIRTWDTGFGHHLICLHRHLLYCPGSFQSLIGTIPPLDFCRAMHIPYGLWSVTFLHASHPNERLPQVLKPPSGISLALSAGTWEIFKCTPLPISDYKKSEGCVKPSLSGYSMSSFLFFCLCHIERGTGYSMYR